MLFLFLLEDFQDHSFPTQVHCVKPFATNFTNTPPYYDCMLCIVAMLCTFFDKLSSSMHKGITRRQEVYISLVNFIGHVC
jgi:hypothetical protein